MDVKTAWKRTALVVSFPDTTKAKEVYGFAGNSGMVNLEGQLLSGDAPSKTVFVFRWCGFLWAVS